MTFRAFVGRIGLVALLAWLSVEIHELGHFAVYVLAGHPARMSFQRVSPAEPVSTSLVNLALLGGPAVSLAAAIALLLVARRRRSFAWVTASFTNASIRVFPCALDLLRALTGGRPFSDEGELALAFTGSQISRVAVMVLVLAMWLALTTVVAREYDFRTKRLLKAVAIYGLSLLVGITTVIADDLLGFNG
jgi:fumarate reductase subunit D